jgi:hypothetical protein
MHGFTVDRFKGNKKDNFLEVSESMKNKLKLAGIIVFVIGFAIVTYLVVNAYTTPNYNLASTPKPPYWVNIVALLIITAGLLLFNLGGRQSRKNPS